MPAGSRRPAVFSPVSLPFQRARPRWGRAAAQPPGPARDFPEDSMTGDLDSRAVAARSSRAARAVALLGAAAPLATVIAFAAAPASAPLAAAAGPLAGRAGPPAMATGQRPALLGGSLCRAAVAISALPAKWPDCAGD
jgi:hypothetical protein